MELTKKLKSRSLKKRILPVCLLLIVAVVFLLLSEADLLIRKPVDLYDVPRDELEGKYVTVEVPFIYAGYAYTEEYKNDRPTGRITSSEYIIDANEEDYCGLLLPESMVDAGNDLMEESDQYYYGEIDEMETTLTVTGIMKKMPNDSLDFYHEVVDYDNQEDQDTFLPLYLVARDSGDTVTTVIFLVLGLGCLVWAILLLTTAAGGKNQKQLLKKAEELSPGNPEYILQQVDQLYTNGVNVGGLRMNANLILIEQGANHYLHAAGELVWAYKGVTQHRVNGVPTGKSYNLIMVMRDRTTRSVTMQENQVDEQLQKINALIPNVVLGYDEELGKLFNSKSPELMTALSNRLAQQNAARAQMQAAAEAAAAAQAPEAPAQV